MCLSILPLALYSISEETIDWFCNNDIDQLKLEFSKADSPSAVQSLEDGKQFVLDVDASLAQRTVIMCTSECPCDADSTEQEQWGTGVRGDAVWDDNGVDNWADCAELIGADTNASNEMQDALVAQFDGLLQALEEDFDCQGLCTPGNFYLYREVDDGPPPSGCMKSIKKTFNTSAGAAIVVMFLAVAVDFFLFIWMFAMCKNK